MLLDIINKKIKQFQFQQELSSSSNSKPCEDSPLGSCSSTITFDFIALIRQENAPIVGTGVTLIDIVENNLTCIKELYSVNVDVPNPCGTGVIRCPVSLNRFKYNGFVKIALNIPLTGTTSTLYQYFSDYLYVDSIRCYSSINATISCPPALGDFLEPNSIKAVISDVGDPYTLGYVPVIIKISLVLTTPCTLSNFPNEQIDKIPDVEEIPIMMENSSIEDNSNTENF